MVVTDMPRSSDAMKPWLHPSAARSTAVKPKLRLHTDDEDNTSPLKFTQPVAKDGAANSGPEAQPDTLNVEHAIQDAQRRLDDLRKLLFPDDDDRGPSAA